MLLVAENSIFTSTQFVYGIMWSCHGDSCANADLFHDGRGTSINVLLHPYLRDALSSSFTASVLLNTIVNAEETSRRWIFSSLTVVTGLRRMLPLLLVRTKLGRISTDTETRHQLNPLAATPLFSPARAALFGLVVYKPRGRKVAKPKICRKAPVSGNAPCTPLCQPGLVSNGKSHLGHGSF
ncbi:hypothetical protein DAPPUDRAFT_243233 [Daphnia pulex]|uniref:Uncharacterized protein n=1 Tax=Daphnia pulex TaxID=6669 RepID=E9GIA5_DAPPU|nr:hypothetical protein DAPPUDRAFT_243233 [Daphnia pulex]|eukprot:EFX80643.1 hypothetical protein DAPPUDRAFT_243233 [Daphnia pulex]